MISRIRTMNIAWNNCMRNYSSVLMCHQMKIWIIIQWSMIIGKISAFNQEIQEQTSEEEVIWVYNVWYTCRITIQESCRKWSIQPSSSMNICGWQPYQASILPTIWSSIFTWTMETWRHIKINYVQDDHNLKSFAD